MSRFQTVLPRILKHEGGKVDDPRDPGGRTNQGVTQGTFNRWLTSQGQKARDVFTMQNAERDAIYRSLYWDSVWGDQLPAGLDYVMIDGAVHSGPSQAIKWLQRALGRHYTGTIDGRIGRLTIAAVNSHPNLTALVNAVLDRRLAFLEALKTFKTYGRGWTRRVKEVRDIALTEARGSQAVVIISSAPGKAPITDAKKLPGTTAADAATAGGVGSGGTAVVIEQAQDALAPYAGVSSVVQAIFVGLIVLGVVLTVGGIVLRVYNTRKRDELTDKLNLSDVNEFADGIV